MEQNAKCDSGRAGKEGGKGKGTGIKVLPGCFFGIRKKHRKRFSLKKPIGVVPSPPTALCLCTNETNLFSTLSDFCFVTEELGGCDSKKIGARCISNQEITFFKTIPDAVPSQRGSHFTKVATANIL